MTSDTAPVAAPPLARNRHFHLLWAGEAVSVLGSMTTVVLLPVLAATTFHASASWMGLLTAAVWLPWLLLGLPVGAWVDRGDNRRIMIAADLLGAAAYISVPLAWWLDLLTLPHLAAAALAGGLKDVFFRTAYAGLLTRIVRPADLEPANGRIFGTESAMQVAGPGVGGLLLQVLGAASGILANAVAFLVSALCLWRIRPAPRGAVDGDPPREPLRAMVRDGLRVTASDRYLAWFTVQGGVSNFALTGYGTLLVLFMLRDLDVAAGSVGVLMALGSAGGLVGATVAGRLSRRWGSARAMLGLQLLAGPPALLVGLARPGAGVGLIPLGAALVGVGVVGANVIRGAFRQRWTPPDLLGRTLGASAVVNYGTMPLAALVAGLLGDAAGLRPTILGMAALHTISCLATWWSPWARRRDLPAGRLDAAWEPDQ